MNWNPKKDNPFFNLKQLSSVEDEKHLNHFNDGKCDSIGRMWVGTLTRNHDLSVPDSGGALYMFDGNNIMEPKLKIGNVSISNGIAWSKNNENFYFIDSQLRNVQAFKFDLKTGEISKSLFK